MNLYIIPVFFPSSNRRFRVSEGNVGTLVMKKPVDIVHLVTKAQMPCFLSSTWPHCCVKKLPL